MLPFTIIMTIVSVLISCVVVAVKLARKSMLMMKTHPKETITQSVATMTISSTVPMGTLQNASNSVTVSSNASLPLDTLVSGLPTRTTMTPLASPSPSPSPILSSSNLASVYVDGENSKDIWGLLVWQDGAGSLSYMNSASDPKSQIRVEESLKDTPKAKKGTPMAAAVDDTGSAHVFYLDENDIVSHIFMKSASSSWKRGGLSAGDKRTAAHGKSTLSAAFHHGEHDTNVVVLSYQDPDSNLQLTMSEDPETDEGWYTVDFASFMGRHRAGDWGGVGHAIAGDWQNKRQDSDGSFSGLLMAVEESEKITPWECSVDFHASSTKHVECHALDRAFIGRQAILQMLCQSLRDVVNGANNICNPDSDGRGVSLPSRTTQVAWIRTGHGKSKAPAQTLPYEFALLYLDSEGSIQENRVGVDISRVPGPGFNVDMVFDSLATNANKTVYAKSGSDVVVFGLDADGWQWEMEGIINTTFSKTSL